MRDVARAAGVSVSAVSLAMRNNPKISAERRNEILRVADQLGYRRDPRITELMEHLRTARPHRTESTIAIVIPELNRTELAQFPPIQGLIDGAKQIAAMAGFGVDILHLVDPGMSLRRVRQILFARGIKGAILAPCASGVARMDFDCTDLCVATAGYSIVEPRLHRACPNYLQMMDELIADCLERGYRRIGLVMTYNEGGIGHKLFTSSFLFYQSKLTSAERLPILPKTEITAENLLTWIERYRPDVIISAGSVYAMLQEIGLRVPQDVAFASIDVSQSPTDAAGADHRYDLVGGEAVKQVLGMLNLNLTGVPQNPKTVLVDSHRREGFSLPDQQERRVVPKRSKPAKQAQRSFRGFVD